MSDLIVTTLITNGTIIVVALLQRWSHKAHETVSEQAKIIGAENSAKLDVLLNGNSHGVDS